MNYIFPSLLSANFTNLEAYIKLCEEAKASMLHIDVMDGTFVPNITIGQAVVSSLRKTTDLELDCHLMIQTMEAWFIADIATLKNFYGQGFKENTIPKNANVETIAKNNLEPTLKTATRGTTKGEYHKINHAYQLLERIDVDKVCQASPYCDRLFNTLKSRIRYLPDES